MKLLQRGLILTLIALAGLFIAGCGNFNFGNPMGVSTVTLSIGNRSLTQDQNTNNWNLSFTLNAYTLPGSPAGVINSFQLQSGGSLTARVWVGGWEATATTDCGPFSVDYSLDLGTDLPPNGSYVITGYTIVGQNGTAYTQVLAEPLVIH